MKRKLSLLLPLLLCCCTQNQLILDPFDEGESLMIQDEAAILEFEQLMADVATPENEYKKGTSDTSFFNSADVISTVQNTQPMLGICRNGDKEYYYHIERDTNNTLITDLDMGMTDYIVSPEKYKAIIDFIQLHTPVPPDYNPTPEEASEENTEKDSEDEEEEDKEERDEDSSNEE